MYSVILFPTGSSKVSVSSYALSKQKTVGKSHCYLDAERKARGALQPVELTARGEHCRKFSVNGLDRLEKLLRDMHNACCLEKLAPFAWSDERGRSINRTAYGM